MDAQYEIPDNSTIESVCRAIGVSTEQHYLNWLSSPILFRRYWNDLVQARIAFGVNAPGIVTNADFEQVCNHMAAQFESEDGSNEFGFCRDTEEWDLIDHYAWFLYAVADINTTNDRGIFRRELGLGLSPIARFAVVWSVMIRLESVCAEPGALRESAEARALRPTVDDCILGFYLL